MGEAEELRASASKAKEIVAAMLTPTTVFKKQWHFISTFYQQGRAMQHKKM